MTETRDAAPEPDGAVARLIAWCLDQRLVVAVVFLGVMAWGVMVAPFDWSIPGLARDPVPVDAIPDLGENQQIVLTEWPGRSPQDIDDQITYPLTVALLGVPGVKSIRSSSAFGFSTIYVIFDEGVEFYWSRSRILERLSALPAGTLPPGVTPALGPDATALGQVFWYTLEGRDDAGRPAEGWGPEELRSIQDFIVKPALTGVPGVAEVASIGGFVREYQVDVDPDAMRAAGVTLSEVIRAVRESNLDVGARTIEVNRVEYIVRGLGFIERAGDLEQAAVTARGGQPILVRDIAEVSVGPALRRGVLTKGGAEAVGGVVVVRFGENPMAAIARVKDRVASLAPGLPAKTLEDGTTSRVTVVPFYDRTGLIKETLRTLDTAISQQVLITVIVIVLMVMHLRSSALISVLLPAAVLMTFIAMKSAHVDANIVALSGIAIAIGTVVDMGIVLTENILRRLDGAPAGQRPLETVRLASAEVGSAVLTAVATTVVGFLPVFTMQAAEGKLFKPLAYTKTFALIASIVLTLTVLPVAASVLLGVRVKPGVTRALFAAMVCAIGIAVAIAWRPMVGATFLALGLYWMLAPHLSRRWVRPIEWAANLVIVALVLVLLAGSWEPVGADAGAFGNALFIAVVVGGLLLFFWLARLAFPSVLAWALRHKIVALTPAAAVVVLGATVWLGFDRVFGWLPEPVRQRDAIAAAQRAFPGLGSEFMPALDEGAFLYMPTTMPHASIGEATEILKALDRRILSVPEVETAVGKLGRVESPLDPAPISMIETLIQYKSEYMTDDEGRRRTFRYDEDAGSFVRDDAGELIPDPDGRPFRRWRDEIRTPQDIWDEIAAAADMPGVTGAPMLQPIQTRLVMLQSGFRAPMGIKVFGPDLATIEAFGLELERLLKTVPAVEPSAVFADRIVGKPYLEIAIDRERIARYGLRIADVQRVIEVAVGGAPLTVTVEGRERYPVRVRYLRELRDQPETLGDILVPAPQGAQIPLRELATIDYHRGPQTIKSEDTFLVSYVLFDKRPGVAEVDAVDAADAAIRRAIDAGALVVPAGVRYEFAGSYENQVRAAQRLALVLPASLLVILLLLYLQFRRLSTTLFVFSGVFVAWGGGFLMLWLYAQPWFLDVSLMGVNLRELFQVRPYNLSVAVWVGFLALFGIATDDGVIMATRIRQALDEQPPTTVEGVRRAVVEGGTVRIRAAVMTSATTILALLPVLSSAGRGADVMIPMAIPTFGGMSVAAITWFTVPILCCWRAERAVTAGASGAARSRTAEPAAMTPAPKHPGP
ncbi:MAG: efflux RND transporter permease subunit [Planctomycetota bacterium]|nr:MAG: efflux RND transporter permease subunit [Planctomycetota bacterium]